MMRSIPRFLKRGFTLIELIMTIVVVGIIAVPISLLLTQHITSTFQSEDLAMAVDLARFEMEKVNNLAFANIINYTNTTYDGYNYTVNRVVNYAQGSGATAESLKQINVTVTKSGNSIVLANITTYIAKNINYGL